MLETILPKDEQEWLQLRTKDITSTEISALFGISPYQTEFGLWHRKKAGDVVKLESNERMEWGTALQDAIAAKIAEKQGWNIRRINEYMRDTEIRAGSSFDFGIKEQKTLLEIKNVDGLVYKNEWKKNEDGSIEAPLHIEIQVQHQLMVSGYEIAYIGALVGGNSLELIRRERNEKIIAAIKQKIVAFWKSIDENNPPKPNFERDASFISSLYNYADPGKVADIRDNEEFLSWAREYKRLGDIAKDAETKRDAIKAQMLMVIGDAEKVEGGEFSISAGIIGESPISYVRKAYRNFKLTWRKQK